VPRNKDTKQNMFFVTSTLSFEFLLVQRQLFSNMPEFLLTPEAQVAIIARPVDSYEDEKAARSILEQASRFDSFSTAEYNGSSFIGNNQGLSFAEDHSVIAAR
jgi:hypothetical protein